MIDLRSLVVSNSTPSGNISSDSSMDNWLWYKPSTRKWHIFSGGTWNEIPYEDVKLEGSTIIDGKLFVGEDEGYHEDIQLTGLGTLKVRRGVIIGWKKA